MDWEAENASVEEEVARNITIKNSMADVYYRSRDFQHLLVCHYGHGYCPQEARCCVITKKKKKYNH